MPKSAEARETDEKEQPLAEKQAALAHLEQTAAHHPHEGDTASPVHVVHAVNTVKPHPFEGHTGSPHVVHPATKKA
ncbi:MAG TPA: hypothetical protein VKX25_19460 [Bryobacteraceae bacterium]|jgi:hypothetical protein|nr:hypothetical protein [Bryobacteraceae bacterium]